MRFIVLGTSEFALSCARALIDSGQEVCALVSMPQDVVPLNSVDIGRFAQEKKIAYGEFEDINSQDAVVFLKKFDCDFLVCSWPKLIKKHVLDIPRRFAIGEHPTGLPYNRGRHPLHWLIILGHSETKLSFFKMDEGMDAGNILLQVPFTIEPSDEIIHVFNKMNKAAYDGLKMLVAKLIKDSSYTGNEQDESKATYWRKRSVHDGVLDMRMPVDVILRIVRSFSLPYPCAKLIYKNHVINISKALMVEGEFTTEHLKRIEPGKIITIRGKHIQIKTDDAIVELESNVDLPKEVLDAVYIHPPTTYMVEWTENLFNHRTTDTKSKVF